MGSPSTPAEDARRRPYASENFLYCAQDHAGVTAAELHDLDRGLLASLRRLDFLFVRKVRAIAPEALAAYLASIGAAGDVRTTTSKVTGHVWGENE